MLVGAALLLAACGTSTGGHPAGTSTGGLTGVDGGTSPGADAGHPDGGPIDAGSTDAGTCGTGGACNSVTQSGAPVAVNQLASDDAPVPVGGTFVPGTYVLTHVTIFVGCSGPPTNCVGPSGPTGQALPATTAVVTVSGGAVSMQIVQTRAGCDDRENVDITISGPSGVPGPTQIAATRTCPGTGDGFAELVLPNCRTCSSQWAFSVDRGSFTLYTGKAGANEIGETFTLQ